MKHAWMVAALVLGGAAVVDASSLDKSLIRKPIRAKLPQIRACYEKALEKDPKLEGKVVVKFVIGKDGKVSESSGTGLPVVADCVANVVKTIAFQPNMPEPATVSYPFVFSPGRR